MSEMGEEELQRRRSSIENAMKTIVDLSENPGRRECVIPISNVAFVTGQIINNGRYCLTSSTNDTKGSWENTEDALKELNLRLAMLDEGPPAVGSGSVKFHLDSPKDCVDEEEHFDFDNTANDEGDDFITYEEFESQFGETSRDTGYSDGIFEIREFVDDRGAIVHSDVIDLANQMKDLQDFMAKKEDEGEELDPKLKLLTERLKKMEVMDRVESEETKFLSDWALRASYVDKRKEWKESRHLTKDPISGMQSNGAVVDTQQMSDSSSSSTRSTNSTSIDESSYASDSFGEGGLQFKSGCDVSAALKSSQNSSKLKSKLTSEFSFLSSLELQEREAAARERLRLREQKQDVNRAQPESPEIEKGLGAAAIKSPLQRRGKGGGGGSTGDAQKSIATAKSTSTSGWKRGFLSSSSSSSSSSLQHTITSKNEQTGESALKPSSTADSDGSMDVASIFERFAAEEEAEEARSPPPPLPPRKVSRGPTSVTTVAQKPNTAGDAHSSSSVARTANHPTATATAAATALEPPKQSTRTAQPVAFGSAVVERSPPPPPTLLGGRGTVKLRQAPASLVQTGIVPAAVTATSRLGRVGAAGVAVREPEVAVGEVVRNAGAGGVIGGEPRDKLSQASKPPSGRPIAFSGTVLERFT